MFPLDIISISRAEYEERLRNAERPREFGMYSVHVPSPFLMWLTKLINRLVAGKVTVQRRTLSRPTPAR